MKKLLYLSLILVSFTSCKKKYCWQCAISQKIGSSISSTTNTQCDKTEAEIRQYEKDNTITKEVFNGNNVQTNTLQSASCSKQ